MVNIAVGEIIANVVKVLQDIDKGVEIDRREGTDGGVVEEEGRAPAAESEIEIEREGLVGTGEGSAALVQSLIENVMIVTVKEGGGGALGDHLTEGGAGEGGGADLAADGDVT